MVNFKIRVLYPGITCGSLRQEFLAEILFYFLTSTQNKLWKPWIKIENKVESYNLGIILSSYNNLILFVIRLNDQLN